MPITDPLILPPDVVLVPVDALPESVQATLRSESGEYSITRPGLRATSKILDRDAAQLLQEFRSPKPIVQAVVDYSLPRGLDAEQVLAKAYPLLRQLLRSHMLVRAGSPEEQRIQPLLKPGDKLEDLAIDLCLQVLDDSEVHLVKQMDGAPAVLKILRRAEPDSPACRMLSREAWVLTRLEAAPNPKLIRAGNLDGRPFLLMEFCQGIPCDKAALSLRGGKSVDYRANLIGLCCRILEAYAQLHAAGVVHGDVHPRNVLISEGGRVRLVDFGLAYVLNAPDAQPAFERGGIGYFFDPQYARAAVSDRAEPLPSVSAEQYSLGALIYLLLTGQHYLDFSIEKREMLQQIIGHDPVPFSRRGVAAWPPVETVLGKALSKDPNERWNTVAEFASALRDAARDTAPLEIEFSQTRDSFLTRTLAKLNPEQELFQRGLRSSPLCSINMGAAGIAYALYRLACQRTAASLLSAADLWSTRASSQMSDERAFFNADLGHTQDVVGSVSLYHTQTGVHFVQALISHAMGDIVTMQNAVENFIAASMFTCDELDLTLGRSGTLLAASFLMKALPFGQAILRDNVRSFGLQVANDILEQINSFPPISECREIGHLGIAHGWAGILYALLSFFDSIAQNPPVQIEERLEQLASCAEPADGGMRWNWRSPLAARDVRPIYMAGWCGGTAGLLHLWCIAHRRYANGKYAGLAEQAGHFSWAQPFDSGDLCCGLAGRGYAFLRLYKETGEKSWLAKASHSADQAIIQIERSCVRAASLYKGEIGVALLAADLECPESSCMPVFESEGW